VIEQGGIQHQNTIDCFKFDAPIYAILCEFAGKLEGFKQLPIREEEIGDALISVGLLRAWHHAVVIGDLPRTRIQAITLSFYIE
jgi:hypothetical protein